MRYTNDSFPFRAFRTVGTFLILFGVVVLAAGAFNVVWSVVKYTNRYSTCNEAPFLEASLEDPCDNDQLNWTWASSGIWGGVIFILVGILGAMFSRFRTRRLKFQRDMFTVSCTLLVIAACPAVLAVTCLELYYQNGIFYKWNDNSFDTEDVAKLAAPLVVGGATFLCWMVAIAGSLTGCCCASLEDRYAEKRPPPPQGFYPPPPMPQQQPQGMPTVELVGIMPPYGPPPPQGLFGPPPPQGLYGPPPGPPALNYY